MILLSLSEMITAELRGALNALDEAEAAAMPSVEAFNHISPLPIWLESETGGLRYCCSISRVLAARHHLDMKFLTERWREAICTARRKEQCSDRQQNPDHDPEAHSACRAAAFFLRADTQMYRDEDLLVWKIERRGGLRWLAMAAQTMATASAQSLKQGSAGPDTSYREGLQLSGRQRRVEREFAWQTSHASCVDINRRAQTNLEAVSDEGERWVRTNIQEKAYASPTGAYRDYSSANWDGIWPLLLAQMDLVDAIALAPRRWASAVDHLSEAWAAWLRPQVLNDRHLSQIADVVPVQNLACLTQALLSLAIRAGFDAEPVSKL